MLLRAPGRYRRHHYAPQRFAFFRLILLSHECGVGTYDQRSMLKANVRGKLNYIRAAGLRCRDEPMETLREG